MERIANLSLSVCVAGIILSSCGSGSQPEAGQKAAGVSLPAEIKAMMPKGEEIFKTKCIICHQPNGTGVEFIFPPLANSDYLLADKSRAVAQTLNGSKIEMTVNGKKYTQEVTPQVNTKEDAVAVINYVLNNFGNKGGFITLEEVKSIEIKPRSETDQLR